MKRKVFVDSDVILDVLADREPHSGPAKRLFSLMDKGVVEGFTSPLIFSNLVYLLRKQNGHAAAKSQLKKLRILFKVLPMDEKVVDSALDSTLADFEDALQYHCASKAGIETIVTRNGRDYKGIPGTLLTPDEFLLSQN
ncbi:MAG: twitching motility protein PilT [Fibrobacteres bacterium]|nr:twitching motility protein PilT [Fibrobacterota bacterium]